MIAGSPFPTVKKLESECQASWTAFESASTQTQFAENALRRALEQGQGPSRLLNPDLSLVLCGSFARFEMTDGSDYDWTLLVDGVVDNEHAVLGRKIHSALAKADLSPPGSTGTFGNLVFSHELVHRIGGGADSNANLTRRILMLLESRPFSLSSADSSKEVWENVLGNILERYFEEDVHFTPGRRSVPRFLLNDLTRYWRTVCVDYAAKHREQDGRKWAIRNAKLRFSRKLIYASGLAFCLSCQLNPPRSVHKGLFGETMDESAGPIIERAKSFARTPALEFLAAFVDEFVSDRVKRKQVAESIFGSYNWWLNTLSSEGTRKTLETLDFTHVRQCREFQEIREHARSFAKGLELLFFGRDRDAETDSFAKIVLQYIGF
jgi:hypothetical protein